MVEKNVYWGIGTASCTGCVSIHVQFHFQNELFGDIMVKTKKWEKNYIFDYIYEFMDITDIFSLYPFSLRVYMKITKILVRPFEILGSLSGN